MYMADTPELSLYQGLLQISLTYDWIPKLSLIYGSHAQIFPVGGVLKLSLTYANNASEF